MSRLTDLIAQAKARDPQMGADLEREFQALSGRRAFGLNFERHQPEAVELPQRAVRKGDKVRVLPPRGSTQRGDQRLWLVKRIETANRVRVAHLQLLRTAEPETQVTSVEDLVVVAEFRDLIYPGLRSTGRLERGGDKPFHTVINAENYHALKTLLFTHRHQVNAIYIDPPYNTGARDWKYNNDYVEADDHYRHSKWLAFVERRLLLAKELLNPEDSALIITIDEKEYLRLGLLLEQVFPEARIQMVSSVINPKGATRSAAFGRTDEYVYFLLFGQAAPHALPLGNQWKVVRDARAERLRWAELLRAGTNARREDRPKLFYPVFLRSTGDGPVFDSVGESHVGAERDAVVPPDGCVAVWPIRSDGTEGNWQVSPSALVDLIGHGYVKAGGWREERTAISYLKRGEQRKVQAGLFPVLGRRPDGAINVDSSGYTPVFVPGTQWRVPSHEAGGPGGTSLLRSLIPTRRFPFPKSLYAVEDALRFFIENKPNATVLDFFAGSGTTAHAIMRLNHQDGGRRQSISVTNNEVSADEQRILRLRGLRPGDEEWEALGISRHISEPRITAAATGRTPGGEPIKGDYKFTDEFPMSEGFEENVEFFVITYETPVAVSHNLAFARIAPLLWMRAGSEGRRIDAISAAGWEVADTYGVLVDLDETTAFCAAVEKADSVRMVYVVTNDDRRFEAVARRLPHAVQTVRLWESYLANFRFANGD